MDDKELNKYIGQKIKFFRQQLGLTQAELGKKIGVKNSTISGYEIGTRIPKRDFLFKVSNALNVPIDDFFPKTKNSFSDYGTLNKSNHKILPKYVDLQLVFQSGLEIRFAGHTLTKKQVRQLRRVLYGVFSEEIDIKPAENWDKNIVKEIKVVESIEEI